jgi:hypothetical protein
VTCGQAGPDRAQPLLLVQQTETPLERGFHGAVPIGPTPVLPTEEGEPRILIQKLEYLRGGQHRHPRGRQLQRQGNPVQKRAESPHGRSVVRGEFEVRCEGPGPVHEELHGFHAGQITAGLACGSGDREGGDGPADLFGNPQSLPARCEDPECGALLEQMKNELRAGVDQVLAVVEHDEPLPVL